MRTATAVLAGVIVHFVVILGLSIVAWPAFGAVGAEESVTRSANESAEPSGMDPVLLWSMTLAAAVFPALAGGLVAGLIARSRWLLASAAIGLWSAANVHWALDSVEQESLLTLSVVGMVVAVGCSIAAGSRPGARAHAAAS